MKRSITVLLIAALAGVAALPGPAAAASIRLGLKAGGNIARPTGLDAQDPLAILRSRMGIQTGLFLAVDLGRTVSVQYEVLYTMKGATYVALDGSATDKLSADYIEVPLLLKIRIPSKGVQPFVFGGPTVGFKLREKLVSNGAEVPLEEALLKNNDYGAIVGAGLNLGPRLALDVRYSLGAQRVLAYFEGGEEPDFKNGVFAVTFGYAF